VPSLREVIREAKKLYYIKQIKNFTNKTITIWDFVKNNSGKGKASVKTIDLN
jgi:hypothetical protein